MSLQPLTFTGVSSLSESLQLVLNRAVSIAAIPLTQLQNSTADVLQKKTLLSGVGSAAERLGAAVAKLGTISSSGALSASSSNTSKVTVQNTGSTTAVAYTLTDITSLATAASASTKAYAVSNTTRASMNGTVELEVDDVTYNLTLAKNSLVGLRDAINSAKAGVTATILTAGEGANYLSISADSLGEIKNFRLTDDPARGTVSAFTSSGLGSNGAAASGMTGTFADPDSIAVSATGLMELVVNGQPYSVDVSGTNSLNGLRDVINGLGAGVIATVVTDAGSSYLSVSADSPGLLSDLTLTDDPGSAAAAMFTVTDLGADPTKASGTTATLPDTTNSRVSMTGAMQLVIGEQTHDIALEDNSLTGLRDAINALGAGVTATIVTEGTSSHLSISADAAGEVTAFELTDNPLDEQYQLLEETLTGLGADAKFKLNGIAVEHKTNTINDVVPGVTFNILDTTSGTEKVTLTLSSDRSQLSSAISEFVTAYNSMQSVVGAQIGANAGLLTGSSVVRDVQSNMRALSSYNADGTIRSLAEMGITFDSAGKMSFDTATFSGLSDSQFAGGLSFFGSSTSGFGALAKKFTELTDPVTGTIRLEQDGYDRIDKNLQSQIATLEERITVMQTAMASRLQLADALLAQLESQRTILDASIQSANLTIYGRNDK
jgi:flagellar hook-associated protein 2